MARRTRSTGASTWSSRARTAAPATITARQDTIPSTTSASAIANASDRTEDRPMIGVDWGTTSFRAFRMTDDGTMRDRRAGPRGLVNVPDNRFADTLREEIGP